MNLKKIWILLSTIVAFCFAGCGERERKTLELKYDDHYIFDAEIKSLSTVSVTSSKIREKVLDEAVLKVDSDNPACCIAVGVGTAKVTLNNGDVYDVTISPATISVALIVGQSNAEGSTAGTAKDIWESRESSIACPEGQVYSTYGWSTVKHAAACCYINAMYDLTEETAKNFVAKSLTSSISYGETELLYPLDTLNVGGKGKIGIDSGLAYEWNKKTGEKIWVVNCAVGGSKIATWLPGGNNYNDCVALMEYVNQTLEAEVEAGHYELSKFIYFWCQGESDNNMSSDYYYESLKAVHLNLKENLSLNGQKICFGGNIMVRALAGTTDERDIANTGPRVAQKKACAETEGDFADFYMACDVNDLWITDKAVEEYWEEKYPDSIYSFVFSKGGYKNPTTVAKVYNAIHYFQVGYNEIGIVSADSAVEAIFGLQ